MLLFINIIFILFFSIVSNSSLLKISANNLFPGSSSNISIRSSLKREPQNTYIVSVTFLSVKLLTLNIGNNDIYIKHLLF